MDYSEMHRDSQCLDQILIFIFIILIIFVVVYYFNKNNSCNDIDDIDEKFRGRINYASVNDNIYSSDRYSNDNNNQLNSYYNLSSEMEMNTNSNIEMEMNTNREPINLDMDDTEKFLKRINDKYNHIKMENQMEKQMENQMENQIESFANLEYDNMPNNVNKLSSSENISGFLNGEQACNMDEQQKELVDDYKKKYFRMYRHQIECHKDCQLSNLRRCNLSENNNCEGIFTNEYNNPDVFTLGHLALDRNNKRDCVTCTSNDDRQTRNMINQSENSTVNEEDEVKINQRRLNNRNKFADFNDYIERNGVMETSVDKIAELRTSNTGTCGLNSYGKKVSDVYNNLLSTTYSEVKNQCVNGPVEGVNDSNSDDTYASVL